MNAAPRQPDPAGAPTTDELLAMAYADGELSPQAVREFETRLAREARLRVLVADQQRIAVLAREAAPAEPLELSSLVVERSVPMSALAFLGRALIALGFAWSLLWLALSALADVWRPPLAGAALFFASGLVLLAARAWAVRRATQHLDPYRDVRR